MPFDLKFTDAEELPTVTGTEIHEDAPPPKKILIRKEDEWRHFALGTPIKVNNRIFTLRKITDKDLVFRPIAFREKP